ncbi:S41 family peptidase [Streptomyces sp. NPDC048636]|uniref:S41 family peptidase n=1 Tax=Streptomyces sp. NPDC048636 TaxID=3155762 RepID=UPI0034464179
MEKNSYVRRKVDWPRLRHTAFQRARNARTPADTYGAIHSALSSLGDRHSFLWEPQEVKRRSAASARQRDRLEGRSLRGRIGYISLPGLIGEEKAHEQYVRRGRKAVAKADRERACGWVVDLRRNSGGDMWPMLAVLGPILGDGTVGTFVDADGKKTPWAIENGSPRNGDAPTHWGDPEPVANSDAPVAVLTDQTTGSSAEAVLVAFRGRPGTRSFGEPTYGVPTGNVTLRLSDGAVVAVMTVKDADRTGRTYDAPIPPDEYIPTRLSARAAAGDPVLEAAKRWLLRRPACR